MRPLHSKTTILLAALACAVSGCKCSKRADAASADGGPAPGASSSAAPEGVDLAAAPKEGPRLGAKALYVVINDEPNPKSKKLGYLRLGSVIERDEQVAGKTECNGGWYKVKPRGFVCSGNEATTEIDDPIIKAVGKRADLSKPMPYAYGFVRAVLPLYLKVPNREEQEAAEFKLKEHLDWWTKEGLKANTPSVAFANDVMVDDQGVPRSDQKPSKSAPELSQGELFGGTSDNDPIPWWLEGGRKIPNVSDFKVPPSATFADRARRHTGLAFVGSFPTGDDFYNRRFAITWDLRLAPTTKVKPDGGAAFHGVPLGDKYKMPVAWATNDEIKVFKIDGEKVRTYKRRIKKRDVIQLTGNKKNVDKQIYLETDDSKWVKLEDVNAALPPDPMPDAAKKGEKWVDISIAQQTLVMWEGNTPVYATLVSTGQDRMGDPKTTKSTVRGTFRIRGKHVTTLMDSNEGLSGKKERDADYGKTKRRGEGSFQLQDVPWVQYFKGGYAIHGAYWHDVFGIPRSHGCVNVAPIDAHRLFFWTTPNLPQGWHGVYSRNADEGTVVVVRE